MIFRDRTHAAEALARPLAAYRRRKDAVILAIPRGGVVLGAVLARALELPLDVILTKKIGHPQSSEYAIGVVNLTSESIDEGVVERDGIPWSYVEGEVARIRALLRKRYRLYRGNAPAPSLTGKSAILVDDGIATGNTMAAAARLARQEGAKRVVVAVPVAPPQAVAALREAADEVVCLVQPDEFFGIGEFYDRFDQVEDEEAIRLLRESAGAGAPR